MGTHGATVRHHNKAFAVVVTRLEQNDDTSHNAIFCLASILTLRRVMKHRRVMQHLTTGFHVLLFRGNTGESSGSKFKQVLFESAALVCVKY